MYNRYRSRGYRSRGYTSRSRGGYRPRRYGRYTSRYRSRGYRSFAPRSGRRY